MKHSAEPPRVLLMVETSLAFGRGVLDGIGQYLVQNPPWSVQLDLRELAVPEPAWLKRWDGDGIICRNTTPETAETFRKLKIPAVDLTDIYTDQGLPSVRNDHQAIGKLAAEHLLERGFKNFAYCGFSDHAWSEARCDGFQKRIVEKGGRLSVHHSGWTQARERGWDQQQKLICDWLESLPRPLGLMACNDLRGQHIMEACRSLKLAVPEQVSVIGVDNDRVLCEYCEPALSSVIPNAERIGYLAAEMLDQLMRDESLQQHSLLVEPRGIETRSSTDILAIDDPVIADALRYIRENACRGMSVGDLLANVPISRSILERRIRKYLGRSPQAEIRNVQLKRVCQLLAETDLTIDQISRLAGFKHSEYLSVVFKRELGQTPGAYRAMQMSK